MTYNGDIFSQLRQNNQNTALQSIAERQLYPASMADKQSRFPELNAALRHILTLYRTFHWAHIGRPSVENMMKII